MQPSRVIGNFLLPTPEVVIMNLSHSRLLLSGIMEDTRTHSYYQTTDYFRRNGKLTNSHTC